MASGAFYYQWGKYIDRNISILPIELAGKGARSDEINYSTFSGGHFFIHSSQREVISVINTLLK
ncbi:hypothetical protein [Paenibacillus sp. MER TA 81-3]|uniref:hypothetical protein n=1 Tax=Paenibacillus sp. MER TA 81-3 TaxID=2939573 RepID=UPI00204029D3|nr:hypothetical protein [Paenibacillus sp. MER TA 81-3]